MPTSANSSTGFNFRRSSQRFPMQLARHVLPALMLLGALISGALPYASLAQTPPTQGDLGDAPDSTNHQSNTSNTAYSGVPGRFPTVWETTTGGPSGPLHASDAVRLGNQVSLEKDADLTPDPDSTTNILAAGADVANGDGGDDGWLNRDAPFVHCRETTLAVVVAKSQQVQAGRMFLNVWFDGNRDGDWADTQRCSDNQRTSFEWIVQNFVVDTNNIPVSSTIVVPTFLVLNQKGDQVNPQQNSWLRFTLSNQPAVKPADGPPDGRGPAYPGSFENGETEDYLVEPRASTGQPGTVTIGKTASTANQVVKIGDIISYTLTITHSGGTAPAELKLSDQLPPAVVFAGGPTVFAVPEGSVAPPIAGFNREVGSGAVEWRGTLKPDAVVQIGFQARVAFCPPLAPNSNSPTVRNVAQLLLPDNTRREAVAETIVDCQRPNFEDNRIVLEKRIISGQNDPRFANEAPLENDGRVEAEIVTGQEATYLLRLKNLSPLSPTIHITDALPTGLNAIDVSATSGEARIIDEGRLVLWDGNVPQTSTVQLKIRVKLAEQARCDQRLDNVANWSFVTDAGYSPPRPSNPTRLVLLCRDLGDAPDSTNHFSTAMEAYPGVPAKFHTVFSDTIPGPLHLFPQPLRLGGRVSSEDGADVGFDTDGPHNIEPREGRADLDQYDDGLVRDGLRFTNCQRSQIGLRVSIDPAAIASFKALGRRAFVNVWLDSNRDGDWEDSAECSGQPNSPALPAREHIVIDYPLDIAGALPGLKTIIVPTSGPVAWPSTQARTPAWLRVTLSDRPSNKTLGGGSYGDGRGAVESESGGAIKPAAFQFGETEDYLLRLGGEPGEQGQPDVVVKKRGFIRPFYGDPRNGQAITPTWRIDWAVEYQNAGFGDAPGVRIKDTLEGPQTRVNEFSYPPLPATGSGANREFVVGQLAPGQAGHLVLQTSVPFDTAPGTMLTNTVVISSAIDSTTTNNTAVYTVNVPLLPPLIVFPTPGTTCSGTLTIVGKAQPGVTVDLYVDGSLEANLAPDGDGRWSRTVTLADGTHEIYAVARGGGLSSPPSPTVKVIVDSELSWSPLSLRFVDEHGFVTIPRDEDGRTDESGWRLRLRPSTTYTVSVRLCCQDAGAAVSLDVPGVGTISLQDSDGDGLYQATFTTGDQTALNSGSLRICVTCELIQRCSDGRVLIDPVGVVYDVTKGKEAGLLAGATVTCFQQQSGSAAAAFTLWPAAAFDQVNPQLTGSDGYFSFFTPPGTYRIGVTREGFLPYRSPDIVVVDTPVEFNVPLTPDVRATPDFTVTVGTSGFEPAVLNVPPGSLVAWVNVDGSSHTVTSGAADSAGIAAVVSDTLDSGLLDAGTSYQREISAEGSYTYYDQENPTNSATILVERLTVYLPLMHK